MVKLRLTRVGSKKKPYYRLVATDSRSPRDGHFLEILGHYNPHTSPAEVRFKPERIVFWLKSGATPTDTVVALLKREGIWQKYTAAQAA